MHQTGPQSLDIAALCSVVLRMSCCKATILINARFTSHSSSRLCSVVFHCCKWRFQTVSWLYKHNTTYQLVHNWYLFTSHVYETNAWAWIDVSPIYKPGQKWSIGNKHPGFYKDKYGIILFTALVSNNQTVCRKMQHCTICTSIKYSVIYLDRDVCFIVWSESSGVYSNPVCI